jgi:hypothetical protein
MKLVVRVFSLSIVFAGLAAASVSSATTNALPNHLSASASGPGRKSLPIPQCGPGMPTCFVGQ